MPSPMGYDIVQEARVQMQGTGSAAAGPPMKVENTQGMEAELESDAQAASDPSLDVKEPSRRRRVPKRAFGEEDQKAVEEFLMEEEGSTKKKRRRRSLQEDDHMEAIIAAGMGFPNNYLTEEEIRAGVVGSLGGIEQANYIVIRNHILAKWRQNVDKWLHESAILENIRNEHKPLVRAAYRFLSQAGYINFGVAPAIKERVRTDGSKATMIVIGAGLAGLAAARQLLAFGHKVIVLEGRARPGGRVHTRQMDAGGHSASADLGGSVITGTDGNPLGVLARQLKLPMHHIRSDPCPIYGLDGQRVDEELDKRVEADFNTLLDKAEETRKAMATVADSISLGSTLDTLRRSYRVAQSEEERQLLDWHVANLEYANAGLLHDLSLAFWDQDDPHEMAGDHCFLTGGNGRLVSALADGLPIFYGRTVRTVRYSDAGVRVHTADGQVFEGDMALSTIPLGCLKRGDVTFDPPLPKEKDAAIRRLGFGLLNKVALLFPHNFWGTDLDTFGRVAPDAHRRGEYFLFYSYAAVSGGALLLALVAGEAARRFEKVPGADVIAEVMAILRSIYEPQGILVPNPLSTLCTRWGSDPFAYGSYSHVAVGASGDDYDVMAESCGNGRLFFAGEATTRWHPATMHGAFLTGLREAGWMDATATARAQGQPVPVQIAPSSLSLQAVTLAEVFRKPDMEFGGFSVVLDPRSSSSSAPALLRLILRSPQSLTKPLKPPQDTEAEPKTTAKTTSSHPNGNGAAAPKAAVSANPAVSQTLGNLPNASRFRVPDGLAPGAAPGVSPELDQAAERLSEARQDTGRGAAVAQGTGPVVTPLPGTRETFPGSESLKEPDRGDGIRTGSSEIAGNVNGLSGANGFHAYGRMRAFAQAVGSGLGSANAESGLATSSPKPAGLGLGPLGLESEPFSQGNNGIGGEPNRTSFVASSVAPVENGAGFGDEERRPDNTMTKLFSFLKTEALKVSPRTPPPVGAFPVSGIPVSGIPANGIPAAPPGGTVRPASALRVEPTDARTESHSQASDTGRAAQTAVSSHGVNTLSMPRPEPRFLGAAVPVHISANSGMPGAGTGGENVPGACRLLPFASARPMPVQSPQLDVRNTPLESPASRILNPAIPSSSNGPQTMNGPALPVSTGAQTGTAAGLVQNRTSHIASAPVTRPAVENLADARPESTSVGAGEKGGTSPGSQPSDLVDDKSTVLKVPAANGDAKGGSKKKPAQVAGAAGGRKKRRRAAPTDAFTPPQKELAVYTVVTRGQAEQLREVKGGDRARLQTLVDTFGVKLVGRHGLGSAGEALLAALNGPHLVAGGLLPRGQADIMKRMNKAKEVTEGNGVRQQVRPRQSRPQAEPEREGIAKSEPRVLKAAVRTTVTASVSLSKPKPEPASS